MNILADENIDEQIVRSLRNDKHNVIYVKEMDPGISDEIVLSQTKEINATLLTADKDFGELVFRRGLAADSVILIRLAGLDPDNKARLISSLVNKYEKEMINSFTVITPNHIRIRSIEM